MPLSPQVERAPDKAADPRWTILAFKSKSVRVDFYRRFNEADLSNHHITHPGKRLRVAPVIRRWGPPGDANRYEARIDENPWNSASSATFRDSCWRGPEGQRTGHHHSISEHGLPHGGFSHPATFGVQRSSSSWEFAQPPTQPIFSTPCLPQQIPHQARPLSNGCPAVSIVGPGVTWGYFGSGYDVLWGMGLGAVCISRIR